MRIIGIDPECETTRNALFVLFSFFSGPRFKHVTDERRQGMVGMIENAACIICGVDSPITVRKN